MMKRTDYLLEIVKRHPRLNAKQYAKLADRPHPSVRRDLDQLAKEGRVRRVRNLEDLRYWNGTWEVVEGISTRRLPSMAS